MPEYLFTLVAIGCVTFFMGWHLYNLGKLRWKAILLATVLFTIYGFPMELIFFNNKIWSFGADYMVGWWFWGLPFEEYLFYVVMIPFFMVLPYFVDVMLDSISRKS